MSNLMVDMIDLLKIDVEGAELVRTYRFPCPVCCRCSFRFSLLAVVS